MDTDDPRHGTVAGYVAHTKDKQPPCAPCLRAKTKFNKRRRLAILEGNPLTIPSIGTTRRIQALVAVGYSIQVLCDKIGADHKVTQRWANNPPPTVRATTAARIDRLYRQLALTPATADTPRGRQSVTRALNQARDKGWVTAFAWDDIDDPAEVPAGAYKARNPSSNNLGEPPDAATVTRILGGEWRLPCSPADKAAVVARWTRRDPTMTSRGVHENEWDQPSYAYLERLTGWKVERYIPRDVA